MAPSGLYARLCHAFLVKFLFNVWKNKIVPTLSKVHGARWPGVRVMTDEVLVWLSV